MKNQQPIVVFVDDEPAILRSLDRTFRRELFQVRTTESPQQALEWSQDPQVRLIISDYRMGAMSGLDLLQNVFKARPEVKRFILSGFADEALIQQAVANGEIDQYLLKPWNVDDLRARIHSVILME